MEHEKSSSVAGPSLASSTAGHLDSLAEHLALVAVRLSVHAADGVVLHGAHTGALNCAK